MKKVNLLYAIGCIIGTLELNFEENNNGELLEFPVFNVNEFRGNVSSLYFIKQTFKKDLKHSVC